MSTSLIHVKSQTEEAYIYIRQDAYPTGVQSLIEHLAQPGVTAQTAIDAFNKAREVEGDDVDALLSDAGVYGRTKGASIDFVYQIRKPSNGAASVSVSGYPWREVSKTSLNSRGKKLKELRASGLAYDSAGSRGRDYVILLDIVPFYAGPIAEFTQTLKGLRKGNKGDAELIAAYEKRMAPVLARFAAEKVNA